MALQPELEKHQPNRQLALFAGGIALARMAWQDWSPDLAASFGQVSAAIAGIVCVLPVPRLSVRA
jgi:hypothetical protein